MQPMDAFEREPGQGGVDTLTQPAPAPAPAQPITRGPGRPRRTNDYRLRGLDLDAPALPPRAPRAPRRTAHPHVKQARRRRAVQFVAVVAVGVAVAASLRTFVVAPFKVTNTSMVPTIQANTDVLVVRSSFLTGGVDAGDIVVFEWPEGSRCGANTGAEEMIKRVVATPGQTIWSEDGRLYVDGRLLDQPTWHNPPFGETGPVPVERMTVPDDSYYVLGDNRTDTCDSRVFGAIAGSSIVGEVVATTAQDGHVHVRIV